jgi:alkylhydroperoxidase family enzyme
VDAAIEGLRALVTASPDTRPLLSPYLEKVRARAYTITDGDVAELKQAGVSEAEIFEATVTVAVSEGLRRLDAGLRVIG